VSEIYLATSTTLEPGSWTDKGIVLSSDASTIYNAIDPAAVQDASGKWWITFGSWFDGIYIFSVDSNGNRTCTPKKIAGRPNTALEGPYIFRRGSYYYLFISYTGSLGAPNEKYHIVACRSTKIDSGYVDAGGA